MSVTPPLDCAHSLPLQIPPHLSAWGRCLGVKSGEHSFRAKNWLMKDYPSSEDSRKTQCEMNPIVSIILGLSSAQRQIWKEKSGSSFATLYLLKDNNNGHKLSQVGSTCKLGASALTMLFGQLRSSLAQKHSLHRSINFLINRLITWWWRLRESLEITRCGGIFRLSSPKKTQKALPFSVVAR